MFNVEHTSNILETISKEYPPDSEEYAAIEIAAWAQLFIFTSDLTEDFQKFIAESKTPLNAEQRAFLKKFGLNEKAP